MTDQPERLSTDGLPPGCPAWAGALFGELALESDLTSYRVVEVLGLLEATRESLTGGSDVRLGRDRRRAGVVVDGRAGAPRR